MALTAALAAAWALAATESVWCNVPLRVRLAKPVIDVPGLSPLSPVTVVVPVLVMVDPPNRAKLPARPKAGALAAKTVPAWAKQRNRTSPK